MKRVLAVLVTIALALVAVRAGGDERTVPLRGGATASST
jgi:hypothetical protein